MKFQYSLLRDNYSLFTDMKKRSLIAYDPEETELPEETGKWYREITDQRSVYLYHPGRIHTFIGTNYEMLDERPQILRQDRLIGLTLPQQLINELITNPNRPVYLSSSDPAWAKWDSYLHPPGYFINAQAHLSNEKAIRIQLEQRMNYITHNQVVW